MNKLLGILAGGLAMAFASVASAAPISGTITLGGTFEPVESDLSTPADLDLADGIKFLTSFVSSASGDFALNGISGGDAASMTDFVFDPLAAPQLVWTVGAFTFELESISSLSQDIDEIDIQGAGLIKSSIIGLDDTEYFFSLSGDTTNGIVFAFSTTNAEVPVPGALPLLLSGLAGLGFAARRKKTA